MGVIEDILRAAHEIWTRESERRRGVEEKSWDALIVTVTGVYELLPKHESAIASVVSPVVYDRDLDETIRRYRELVDGASVFSAAYEEAQGELGAAQRFSQFREGSSKNRLLLVSHRLGDFQFAAFTLSWKSEEMANLLVESSKLVKLMSEGLPEQRSSEVIEQQRNRVKQSFEIQAFPSLRRKRFGEGDEVPNAPPIETADDVNELVRTWCKAWDKRIKKILYEGGRCGLCGDKRHEPSKYGLYRILGQLKAARFEGA